MAASGGAKTTAAAPPGGGAAPPYYAFIVYRGERYVGTVIVDILFPTLCGARYSADMQTDPAVGDLATTRLLAP